MTPKTSSSRVSNASPGRGAVQTLSADELTKRNIELIRQLEEAPKQERTRSDLVAEAVANFCGSMKFVWVHVVWFAGWIILNVIPGMEHVDPFPFTFLTLIVSLEAIFLSTFILISQNHDTKINDRRNHLDLQINLLSEQENTHMLNLLRAIAIKLDCEIPNDSELAILSEETDPEKVVAQLQEMEKQ